MHNRISTCDRQVEDDRHPLDESRSCILRSSWSETTTQLGPRQLLYLSWGRVRGSHKCRFNVLIYALCQPLQSLWSLLCHVHVPREIVQLIVHWHFARQGISIFGVLLSPRFQSSSLVRGCFPLQIDKIGILFTCHDMQTNLIIYSRKCPLPVKYFIKYIDLSWCIIQRA